MPVHQRADNAHIGLKAGTEGDNAGLAEEFPQLLLQLQMHLQGSVQKTGAAAAGAVLLQSLDSGLYHIGGGGQAQIVIGAKHNAALALHHHLHILTGLQGMEIGIDSRLLQLAGQSRLVAFFKNIHRFFSL